MKFTHVHNSYRNLKLISNLIQENESRSVYGQPDINTLLHQLIKENLISSEFSNNYRNTARMQTKNLEMKNLFMVQHLSLQVDLLRCNKMITLYR